ncbi:MAG: methylmalonyl-CoA epimerase [Thermoleophilia bacterium]
MLSRIDHLGVAVGDLDAALTLYADVLGLEVEHREIVSEQGIEAVALRVGESRIELLSPLTEDSPVGRFLARRGPGLHHVAYVVEDLAAALCVLGGAGVRLIDQTPRRGLGGCLIAFIHPASAGGVLTELVQLPVQEQAGGVSPQAGPSSEHPSAGGEEKGESDE